MCKRKHKASSNYMNSSLKLDDDYEANNGTVISASCCAPVRMPDRQDHPGVVVTHFIIQKHIKHIATINFK